MGNVLTIGQPPWSRQDLIERLEEFSSLYSNRPIQDNSGGMKSPHMFLAWFALKTLQPTAIIESGVWLGQGTWFIEKACPDARLYCIDLNLERIQYRCKRAEYFDRDFTAIDWSHLPKDKTVVFFDDHQNAYERVGTAKRFGFRHLIFEDNYPPGRGDCYSLKMAFMHSGFSPTPPGGQSIWAKVKREARTFLGIAACREVKVPPNEVDADSLRQNLEVYYEFPPVFRTDCTRWNDPWDDEHYPTPEPLLAIVERDYQQIYKDEAANYTWMCYARLK